MVDMVIEEPTSRLLALIFDRDEEDLEEDEMDAGQECSPSEPEDAADEMESSEPAIVKVEC